MLSYEKISYPLVILWLSYECYHVTGHSPPVLLLLKTWFTPKKRALCWSIYVLYVRILLVWWLYCKNVLKHCHRMLHSSPVSTPSYGCRSHGFESWHPVNFSVQYIKYKKAPGRKRTHLFLVVWNLELHGKPGVRMKNPKKEMVKMIKFWQNSDLVLQAAGF